jgi:putative RNA 2'-phosphotransferase
MSTVDASKFMSYVLRHEPQSIGLILDPEGWASIEDLIQLSQQSQTPLTHETIIEVVRTSDKQRFKLSEDGRRVRTNQGHSIPIDLALKPQTPPHLLYHGTAERFVDSIVEKGLVPGSRQHVHLSLDMETARRVGQRHGKPTVFVVKAHEMFLSGHMFYVSDNGVWLTMHVPTQFLTKMDRE